MARPSGRPVREEVIAAAMELVKSVGVGGFSYGDLAKRLDIKAPSIHHHFRTKEDLVAAIAERYRISFAEAVAAIPDGPFEERLLGYAGLFARTATSGELCLCGAVAAEWLSVGEASRREVAQFFGDQVSWLSAEVDAAKVAGSVRSDLDAEATARLLLAALEGSMLMTRAGSPDDLAVEFGRLFTSIVQPR